MAFQASLPDSSKRLASADFDTLHERRIVARRAIRRLLERVQGEGIALRRGMNRMILPERAWIESLGADEVTLRTENFRNSGRTQQFYSFEVEGRNYFFAADRRSTEGGGRVQLAIPETIHHLERRDQRRERAVGEVSLALGEGRTTRAALVDRSPRGLGLELDASLAPEVGAQLEVGDARSPGGRFARVQSCTEGSRPGWVRLGLATSAHRAGPPLPVERSQEIVALPPITRWRQRLRAGWGVARSRLEERWGPKGRAEDLELQRFENGQGEALVGIVDGWGERERATAVIIPPAWGRTKETLLPLARAIVATFRAQGEPVVVLRFDGIRKRGESANDPGCQAPGDEQLRFTFSQGVRDLAAVCDFLDHDARFRPRKKVLVSFSASSVEARRFVATHPGRVDGWVCVVGTADLQSMMRVISGGVDYLRGVQDGVRFGRQEILGVVVDMDHAAGDAAAHCLADLEDARADMSRIHVPVVWLRGRYDAWMDADRIADILAVGDASQRRHIEIPTGHQLKSSQEALATFQRVAQEVVRITLDRTVVPALPDLADLARRQRAERARLPDAALDAPSFWHDYLLGRDGGVGIELMNETSAYRALMEQQIDALRMLPMHRVLDVGSGTGAFPLALARDPDAVLPGEIVEVDLVEDALDRARARIEATGLPARVGLTYRAVDLAALGAAPIVSEPCDAALASLLVSYVDDPRALLRRIHDVLVPGGRIVVSSLRHDADISRVYRDGLLEIQAGARAGETFGLGETALRTAARTFLNDAARLIDLEELGAFRFYSRDELSRLVASAGFRVESAEWAFGDPPQACLVVGKRR